MRRILLLTVWLIWATVRPVTVRASALSASAPDDSPDNYVDAMEITAGRIDPCLVVPRGCPRTICKCANAITDLDVERIISRFGDEAGLCDCYNDLPKKLKDKIKTRCHKGASRSMAFQEEVDGNFHSRALYFAKAMYSALFGEQDAEDAGEGSWCRICIAGDNPCICTEEYNPVCGLDGKNYSNPCLLHCAGTKLDHYGLCKEKGCTCTFIYLPVCGEDGKTYGNKCSAECANITIAYEGMCQEGIKCGKGIQPALCIRDPCDGYETCPSHPDATCISNYCPGITQFRGSYVNGPCTAIYVDPTNGKPVDCCKNQNDAWASGY